MTTGTIAPFFHFVVEEKKRQKKQIAPFFHFVAGKKKKAKKQRHFMTGLPQVSQ